MNIEILHSLESFKNVYNQVVLESGNSDIWIIALATAVTLAIHSFIVLAIAGLFHILDKKMKDRHIYGGNFVAYFVAVMLIVMSHLLQIMTWTYICLAFEVLPDSAKTFFFAGEMYTTVGYGNYHLSNKWEILPIFIAFTGLFAVSTSGAALYSMMGALVDRGNNGNKS